MGGVLFQYGTAVHLALLTVAPLFLFSFCGPLTHAVVLSWLSLFAAMWIVMNPSPRTGEWPRDARHRIGWEILRDPFLTLGAVALILSFVRAVNGGIATAYNPSSGLWYLSEPHVSLLPGSVSGEGWLPLSGVLGLSVVILGVRHALGARARLFYLFVTATLAALAVVSWFLLKACGVAVQNLGKDPAAPICLGTLLGVFFLFSLISWVECLLAGWKGLEFSSAVVSSVLLLGTILFGPTHALWLFALMGASIAVIGILLFVMRGSWRTWPRFVFLLAVVLVPIALCVAGAIARPVVWPIFTSGFLSLRETASAVAIEAWRSSTRLGLGLGAYPLAKGFFASPENWQVLTDAQQVVPNGWIQFLFERGFLGCAVAVVGIGLLLKDAVMSYIRAGTKWSLSAVHLAGPFVFAAVVALLFVECSYVQPEVLMPVGAALAITAAEFQKSSEADHG